MRDQGGYAREDDHGGEEADEELDERQREDEEADVEPELGVVPAERDAVPPQQHRLPLARDGGPGEDPEHGGDGEHDEAPKRLQRLPVALDTALLGSRRHVYRARPIGDDQRGQHRAGHDERPEDEEQDLHEQLRPVHRDEPQLAVPQRVGPDAVHHQDEDDEDAEGDQRRDQRTGPAAAPHARSRTAGGLGLEAHGGRTYPANLWFPAQAVLGGRARIGG